MHPCEVSGLCLSIATRSFQSLSIPGWDGDWTLHHCDSINLIGALLQLVSAHLSTHQVSRSECCRNVFCVSLNGYGSIPINTCQMLFLCFHVVSAIRCLCRWSHLTLRQKKETRPSHVACSQKRTFLDLPCKWRKPKICCYNAAQDCPNTGGTLRWLCTRASPTHWEAAFTVREVGYIRILQCSNRSSFISIHQRINRGVRSHFVGLSL